MLQLNNLRSPKGAHRNTKRIGRGQGSGQGTQAGKGHKGQKARKGGGVRPGFEGGAMPIYRRLPKRGFKNMPFKVDFAIVNLSVFQQWSSNEEVTHENLVLKGIIKGADRQKEVKILGDGDLKQSLNFKGIVRFSKNAKLAVEKAGGTIN